APSLLVPHTVLPPSIHSLLFFFFFSLLPPPPRSPLFPYTTPFRSRRRRIPAARSPGCSCFLRGCLGIATAPSTMAPIRPGSASRSEEHTSELQSLAYLVCRLLLEKKKKLNREHNCTVQQGRNTYSM